MALKAAMARQLSFPTGLAGRLLARMMNVVNRRQTAALVSAISPGPDCCLLEIGFGGGEGLRRLLGRTPAGRVAGVDISETMVARARRRFRRQIGEGRLEVHLSDIAHLPFPDARFDGAISANTIYFWPDDTAALAETRRVLRPGSPLAIGFRPGEAMARSGFQELGFRLRSAAEVAELLRAAGFTGVEVRSTGGPVDFVVALGRAPA